MSGGDVCENKESPKIVGMHKKNEKNKRSGGGESWIRTDSMKPKGRGRS